MTLRKAQRITSFKMYFRTSEIHGYVKYLLMSRENSGIDIKARKSFKIQILESLILAQDERWRRA